jgi:hypothetical protein
VFTQDFDPTRDARHAHRPLGGFGTEYVTESFEISPDGRRPAVAGWQQVFSLVEAQPLEGLAPPGR